MLKRLSLAGFKSIRQMDLEFRSLNVLIGANGAGKSNLISFFKLIGELAGGRLQSYIAANGRAHSLLFYGPRETTEIQLSVMGFESAHGTAQYGFRLSYAAGDALFFQSETIRETSAYANQRPREISLGSGHVESPIRDKMIDGDLSAVLMAGLLEGCRVYHFHDMSFSSRARHYGYIEDNQVLLSDGANLAAFLYRLQNRDRGFAYERIVHTIRLVAPFFHDFNLVPSGPDGREIILNWRDRESDQVFGPHQLSDGTLRAMCLVALLLQPETQRPALILIDEPELGLHPFALEIVASLIKAAAHHSRIVVSTQSSSLLDQFEPEDVIVVDRQGKESLFRRTDPTELASWLEEYSLGEVWEKNVVGGGPH